MALKPSKNAGSLTGYFDRNGQAINLAKWTAYAGNKEYCAVRTYQNESFQIAATWIGKMTNVRDVPREYWKLFKVEFSNIIVVGERPGHKHLKFIADPQLTSLFGTEKEALDYYFKLLTERGLLVIEEDYTGVVTVTEVGNIAKAAPIVDVDMVEGSVGKKEVKVNSSFGSW